MTPLEELTELGFRPVTHWSAVGPADIKLSSLQWKDSSGWVYSFVAAGTPRYFGKTGGVLRTRMDQYRDGRDQCARIRAEIIGQLNAQRDVAVYGWSLRKTDVELQSEETNLLRRYRHIGLWNRMYR